MDIAKMYRTQISLTEWFEQIQHQDTAEIRKEDNEKRDRLAILNEVIGLPFDRPTTFSAVELTERSPRLQEYVDKHADELCAIRLHPKDKTQPKLRMRGHTVRDTMKWYDEQTIDPKEYTVDFVSHNKNATLSTTFVINHRGIWGEIIEGGLHQLSQGFHERELVTFSFDFKTWQLSKPDQKLQEYLQAITNRLKVIDVKHREQLETRLQAEFAHDYLIGYFETADSNEFGLWYVDYNRILGKMYADFAPIPNTTHTSEVTVRGQIGCKGKVTGRVRVIGMDGVAHANLQSGEILVCAMTTPDLLPLMQKAGAIVTDQGGILSHAAIVSRELQKPCIVATKNATQLLKDGDLVEVNADLGFVIKIS